MTEPAPAARRAVRSFVRRGGRITPAQERALESLWPRYGLPAEGAPLDLATIFGRRAPVILEIGFGNGEALVQLAAAHPEHDYLGIEVHRPGLGALLLALERQGLANVRALCGDAVEVLERKIPEGTLAAVSLFFPDPWPKQRHRKRRLVQPEFVQRVRRCLAPGGRFYLATDWQDYAGQMLAVLTAAEGFANTAGPGGYAARPECRPPTRFERRGRGRGHGVWDLVFERSA